MDNFPYFSLCSISVNQILTFLFVSQSNTYTNTLHPSVSVSDTRTYFFSLCRLMNLRVTAKQLLQAAAQMSEEVPTAQMMATAVEAAAVPGMGPRSRQGLGAWRIMIPVLRRVKMMRAREEQMTALMRKITRQPLADCKLKKKAEKKNKQFGSSGFPRFPLSLPTTTAKLFRFLCSSSSCKFGQLALPFLPPLLRHFLLPFQIRSGIIT